MFSFDRVLDRVSEKRAGPGRSGQAPPRRSIRAAVPCPHAALLIGALHALLSAWHSCAVRALILRHFYYYSMKG